MTSTFITDFDDKMQILNNLNAKLKSSIQSKKDFTNKLKSRLEIINQRLGELVGLITSLKKTADELQTQIGTHTSSINNKNAEVDNLNKELASLKEQINKLNIEYTNYKADKTKQINDLQNKINTLEGELQNANNQASALQKELESKGDLSSIHASEIQKLKDESNTLLLQKEKELQLKIDEYEKRIIELQRQLTAKTDEHTNATTKLDEHVNNTTNKINVLQAKINELNNENTQLIERLKQATIAINQATLDLQDIMDNVSGAQSQQEINQLLDLIENSIQNISRAAQGQPPAQGRPQIDPNITIQLNGYNMTYGQILSELNTKANQVRMSTGNDNNKYRMALNAINATNDPAQIPVILNRNGINIKAGTSGTGVISGGRKTRKNKKQKGGFTYRSSSKRKSINSASYLRSSRKSLKKNYRK